MAYKKMKKEQYANIGGINTKASVYVTGEREVLDLVNYDLQTPGAWTQRMGITNAISGQTVGTYPSGNQRFFFGGQASLIRLDTGGTSFTYTSLLVGNTSMYVYSSTQATVRAIGPSLGFGTEGTGNLVNAIGPGRALAAGIATYYNNIYYSANKSSFKYIEDVGLRYYGLPKYADGLTSIPSSGTSGTGSLSGTYNFRLCYAQQNQQYVGSPGISFAVSGVSGASNILLSGFTLTARASLSGADYLYVYANRVAGLDVTEYALVDFIQLGVSATSTILGSTGGFLRPTTVGSGVQENVLSLIDKVPNMKTQQADLYSEYRFTTGQADCVEFFGDRLYWGVANGENLIFFSEPIEFISDSQTVLPESFILTKNNNFPLIGLKSYNQSLIIFFQKGVNRLTGDNLNNFNQVNLTAEYGLVNSRCIVEFQERLWFLDEEDVIEFNGSNFQDVSNQVKSYLKRMNVAAAQKVATAYHYESRNEVWFAIPIDNATENNLILVFDYNVGGWYVQQSKYPFNGLIPFSEQILSTGLSAASVLFNNTKLFTTNGDTINPLDYGIGYFGEDFKLDFDSGFTLSFKTRYHAEQGHSVTSEWRRFYLDTGPWTGVTLSFNTNFYANFATATISLTRTIYASGSPYSGPQQTRIDFGIPAKSLSVETKISTGLSLPIVRVYGYTIESRFLRNV